MGEPGLAEAVVFLASNAANVHHGEAIDVDGGWRDGLDGRPGPVPLHRRARRRDTADLT